jgi:hypothetical protein
MAYPQSIGSLAHDRLRAGCTVPELVRAGIILANELALTRGAVLGRVAGAATGAAVAGNTGGTTIGSISVGKDVRDGEVYKILIRTAGATGAFDVYTQNGELVGQGVIGTAFTSPHINFTLTDGTPDSAAGDQYTVTVARGTKYRHVNSANTDGSAHPKGVLLKDVAASASDSSDGVAIAFEGEFNEDALTFGGTDTITTHRSELEAIRCKLRKSQNVNGVG